MFLLGLNHVKVWKYETALRKIWTLVLKDLWYIYMLTHMGIHSPHLVMNQLLYSEHIE